MGIIKLISISAIAVSNQLTINSLAVANSAPTPVETVAAHLTGIMDTSAQANINPDRVNVRMTTCEVQLEQNSPPNSIYLYQEQALNKSLDRPYRQRFLQISPGEEPNSVISISYRIASPEAWIGLCDRASKVISTKLLENSTCTVYLKPIINVYIGTTQPGGCPSQFRGATTIRNNIILHDQGMDTYDRGFDANGQQVWGARDEGYQFRWLN